MKRASLIAFAVLACGSAATAATGLVPFPLTAETPSEAKSAPLVLVAASRAAPTPSERRAAADAPSATTGREMNTEPGGRDEAPSKPARPR